MQSILLDGLCETRRERLGISEKFTDPETSGNKRNVENKILGRNKFLVIIIILIAVTKYKILQTFAMW